MDAASRINAIGRNRINIDLHSSFNKRTLSNAVSRPSGFVSHWAVVALPFNAYA
jgi:hypothetical protein